MFSFSFIWLIVALVILLFELGLGTVYLLALVLGTLSGSLCAYLGLSFSWQLTVSAIITILASFMTHFLRSRQNAFANNHESLDQGRIVRVRNILDDGRTQVFYRGCFWFAQAMNGQALVPGLYKINVIDGHILMIEKK